MTSQTVHPRTVILAGNRGQATLIPPSGHHWTAAYLITSPHLDAALRQYVVLIEVDSRFGIGWATIDETLAADARAAGLPETIAVSAQMIGVLPQMRTGREFRALRFLARAAIRDLPLPPQTRAEVAQWRQVLSALADYLVNESLTGD